MKLLLRLLFVLGLAAIVPAAAFAGEKEKDIFNYPAQLKAGKDVKRIVFVADTSPHGPRGNHEFMAGAMYMARVLNAKYPNVYAVVHPAYAWPKDLSQADCIVVLLNHGGPAATNPRVKEAMKRGAGFVAIHYGVEVNKGEQGKNYLNWIGGYFEPFWSVNPFWTPTFTKFPEHEITRGVKTFTLNDEWYYHMRFVDGMKGVTPILSALPKLETIQGGGKKASSHGGNPDVYADVAAGKEQHVAWAYNRPEGGRGFGFTGFHRYSNLRDDSFRTLLLNAVAWTTNLSVPEGGITTPTPSADAMEKLLDEALRLRK